MKKKALRWLGWLAAQLVNRDQIPFALEDLDLHWLPSRRARRTAAVIFSLGGGLGGGLYIGLRELLQPAAVSERSAANEGTSRSLRYALRISSAGVAFTIAIALLVPVLGGVLEGALSDAVKAAPGAAPGLVFLSIFLAFDKGGYFFLRHWAVRAQLQRLDLAPPLRQVPRRSRRPAVPAKDTRGLPVFPRHLPRLRRRNLRRRLAARRPPVAYP